MYRLLNYVSVSCVYRLRGPGPDGVCEEMPENHVRIGELVVRFLLLSLLFL